jgi:hypothetical protein
MLAGLVQWRVNMLAGQAIYDGRVRAQREAWVRVMEKLNLWTRMADRKSDTDSHG